MPGAVTRGAVSTPGGGGSRLVVAKWKAAALNGFEGTESVEDGSREVVRAALAGPEIKGGAFTRWQAVPISW